MIESEGITRRTKADHVDPRAILGIGRKAIATQAEALWALGHGLGASFVATTRKIRRTRGRVVVCGLGKSGDIARKIAATFNATGTPACFLHAGDALHGDLGVMMVGDTVLILSNSGTTREFGVIMRHARTLAIPLMAMTSQVDSVVATSVDIVMLLPAKPEACPFGSSPTTSTTMMLALGDALAIAVMQMRGTDATNLLALHPGGQLGLDLVGVESFMHRTALPLVADHSRAIDIPAAVSAGGYGVAGVIDARRRLVGVITDGDIRRNVAELGAATAADIMTRTPRTLGPDATARTALVIMSEARMTSLFVLDRVLEGRVVGLVHLHDLLRLGVG